MTTEPLDLDELIEHWTLLDGDHELVAGKRGTSRLAFALMLKFYARHGRFPDSDGDLPGKVVEFVAARHGRFPDSDGDQPGKVVEFVARQVQVPPEQMPGYELAGRTVEYYRAQIRGHFGFRECTVEDAQALQAWLAENVAEADPRQEVVRERMQTAGLRARRLEEGWPEWRLAGKPVEPHRAA